MNQETIELANVPTAESGSDAAPDAAPGAALWIARLLALAGFVDAIYLTASHYGGSPVACGPGGGCDLVLGSRWATVGGVPIAALGALYYALASGIVWTPAAAWRRPLAWGLVALTGAAFAVSLGLFLVQALLLHAWCRFCLVSAGLTTALFVSSLVLLRAAPRGAGVGIEA